MQRSKQPTTKQRRVSLSKRRPEIEQWVSEGRSDEWIADALGTSRQSVQSFRSRNRIMRQDIRHGQASSRASESGEEHSGSTDKTASDQSASVFEGVLDQGQEGYGLWLDPAVGDDPLFREGFAGVNDVRVVIERGRIVLEPVLDRGTDQSAESGEPSGGHVACDGAAAQQTAVRAASPRPEQPGPATGSGGEPGRVKWFDADRGYGFITRPDGGEVFFHRSEILEADELDSGEYVLYEPGSSPRGPVAQRVRVAG